jgi:4-amino-4-deoxy-L-arabinose transferase-like glycosyltransferase
MSRDHSPLFVVAILLLAALVRLWGIDHDLPYVYHPDEPINVEVTQRMIKSGDPNPHFFSYPTLFYYLNALAYVPLYAAGAMTGKFSSPADIPGLDSIAMGTTLAPAPSVVLLGRSVTLLLSLGIVALCYVAGRRLTGRPAIGVLAALLYAVAPAGVEHGRYLSPDTFVTFMALVAFLPTIGILQRGGTRDYVAAGLFAGLTASTKYNGALIGVALLTAHFLREGSAGFRDFRLYLALLLCAVGFFAGTPFALLDGHAFLRYLTYQYGHYSGGHAGMEGNTIRWYFGHMATTAGIAFAFAGLAGALALWKRDQPILLLASFPAVYFLFISSFEVRNDRTFLPLTPFLFLLAASLLVRIWDYAQMASKGRWRLLAIASVAVLVGCVVVEAATRTVIDGVRLTTINSRETARTWISVNLPPNSKVALESYAPYIDPGRFRIEALHALIDKDPSWYEATGVDYLVFSEGMFGRFYREPERYANQVARYDALFTRYPLLKSFNDGNYQIRVYQTHSVASR